MRFTKMQGLGNDYVYLDCTERIPDNLPDLARRVSDRHFGVGADGLICICASDRADFRMRMFNADGSEGEMCGNGIRCVGKFVYDKGLTRKTELWIETLAGVKEINLTIAGGQVSAVTVNMGEPAVESPFPVTVAGEEHLAIPVSIGNPHMVIFLDEIDGLNLPEIGPGFENHSHFPQRVNTEFVKVIDRTHIAMRVWERGSGETLACGTGACAVAVAAFLSGKADRCVTVRLLGGDLQIQCMEEHGGAVGTVFMTGPAVTVFEGDLPAL